MGMRAVNKEVVYFISYEDGPIKIGKTVNIHRRLKELQIAHPEKLHILGVTQSISESDLHEEWAGYRLSGEWFTRDLSLLKRIQEIRDLNLYKDVSLFKPIEILDSETSTYGVVQVIDGNSPLNGKYGYYDDDDTELITECDFCLELQKRGLGEGDDACQTCILADSAIVYFGSFINDGYHLLPYESLRRVDDEFEADKVDMVMSRLHPIKEYAAVCNEERVGE